MKKVIFMLLALTLMLAAAACQPPNLADAPSGNTEPLVKPSQSSGDIQMTVKEQTVSGDVESVTLTITNASDKEYTYGARSAIEAEKDGAWVELKPISNLMWIEIAYMISSGQSNEEAVTIKANYGTLASGHYRVVKTFTSEDGSNLTAYGAFAVK